MKRSFVVLGILLAGASTAHAHPLVDEAREAYESADFDRALDALTRAEASNDLALEDLVRLYDLRILVYLGMGDDDALDADLRRLLSIAPAHDFGDAVPPEVLTRASQLRSELGGPIRVAVRVSPGSVGLRVEAEVHDDHAELVRAVRITTRRAGAGWSPTIDAVRWRRGEPSLELPGGARVELYAEALGPGAAVLARDGSESSPRVWDPETVAAEGDDGGVPWLWVGVGVGGAALLAGAIVLAVLVGGGESDRTNPSLPMVSFP